MLLLAPNITMLINVNITYYSIIYIWVTLWAQQPAGLMVQIPSTWCVWILHVLPLFTSGFLPVCLCLCMPSGEVPASCPVFSEAGSRLSHVLDKQLWMVGWMDRRKQEG